tara:strand:- start:548 stop:667 length:120 start_codon:yes stop_codon:yes gene_type:complete
MNFHLKVIILLYNSVIPAGIQVKFAVKQLDDEGENREPY